MVAGANQAVAAARLGASVAMIGCIGDDAFGARLHDALSAEGIDVRHLARIGGTATGVATITVDEGGANSIVVVPGANARLDADRIDAARDAIAGAAMLVSQLEVPVATVARAIACASAHHTPVLLNPAPAQPLFDALLARVDYLVVNETEAESLTGIAVGDDASAVRAADALCAKGVGNVLVTLGARGVLARRCGQRPPAGDVGGRRRYDRGRRHLRRRLRSRSRGRRVDGRRDRLRPARRRDQRDAPRRADLDSDARRSGMPGTLNSASDGQAGTGRYH